MGKDRQDIPVRNTDRTDTDLETFSDRVYEPPKKKTGGCALLIGTILLVLLIALVLKLGGLIA